MPGPFSLEGSVALVTGATGGLGSAIVQCLSDSGARMLLSDLDDDACQEAVAGLCAQGRDARALGCDLSSHDAVADLATQAVTVFGRVDVLVCNAGIQGPAGPIGDVTDSHWEQVMDINLRSALWLTKRLIPAMAERGGGSVILMSSIAGLRGNKSIGLYGLSKAALAQMARNLAVEWGPRNVRVNAVSPGMIRTPLAAGLMADPVFMARRLSMTPLRRVGEPAEVAGVVALLASRAGGFITGQNIVVDGGTTVSDGN